MFLSPEPLITLTQLQNQLTPVGYWAVIGLILALGASVGSFCHLVAGRFLAEESIVSPGSRCDKCNTPLQWFENIPVLAWPLLGGKCRHCKTSIPMDAWLTELATAGLFLAVVWLAGLGWHTLFWWFLVGNCVVIFLTDLREHLIFQLNSLSLIPAGVLMHLLGVGLLPSFATMPASEAMFSLPLQLGNSPVDLAIPYGLVSSLMGILAAWIFFEGAIFLSQKLLGTDGFGHGDTHLMMGIGAYLGVEGMAASLFLGFVLQAVLALPMLVFGWLKQGQWVILISGFFSFVFALLPYLGQTVAANLGISSMVLLTIGLIGSVISLLVFLRQLRNQESFVYVPLGPALILGSLVIAAITLNPTLISIN